jgi:3-deoxy-D-manno-octulosonate 8-phosphate phosphatase (KDO 8-P phosphatase)
MNVNNDVVQLAKAIKLVIFDVDGVLTDGTLVYGDNGEEVKHFNVKDGVGIKLLRTYGIEVGIISAKSAKPLSKRMSDLGIKHFYPGSHDKQAAYKQLLENVNLANEQVAYVGDDVIDLTVMQHVGLPIAVADAYVMVRQQAIYITKALGGKGVAREVADLILGSQMNLEEAYIKAMLPDFELRNADTI